MCPDVEPYEMHGPLMVRSLRLEPGLVLIFSRAHPYTAFVFFCFQGLSFPNQTSSRSWSKGLSCGWRREDSPRAAIQVRARRLGALIAAAMPLGRGDVSGSPEESQQREEASQGGQIPPWTTSVPWQCAVTVRERRWLVGRLAEGSVPGVDWGLVMWASSTWHRPRPRLPGESRCSP